jgi:hypothetical protein
VIFDHPRDPRPYSQHGSLICTAPIRAYNGAAVGDVRAAIGDVMSDTRDPQTVIAAAEQAANASDFPAAERLLLEAANLQEASLGPAHPDLANTYNNLGVVYEITGKPADAELSFRRAYKIATVAFPAHHPFVATSRKNLEDFCAARGIAVDPPAPAPVLSPPVTEPPALPVPAAVETTPAPAPAPPPKAVARAPQPVQALRAPEVRQAIPAPPPSRPRQPIEDSGADDVDEPPRGIARGAFVAFIVLLAVVAIGLWYRSRNVEPTAATEQAAQQAPAAAPATTPPPPAAPPTTTAEQPRPKAAPPPKPQPPVREKAPAAAATRTGLVVVEASVCRNLVTSGNWRCPPVTSPVAAGPLVFYTRIKSDRNTKVQHRWYRGNELRRSSDLGIIANPGSGYRTFSRFTVSGAGEWRVELRSADGALLRDERFTVR